jgi:hypothetical protein
VSDTPSPTRISKEILAHRAGFAIRLIPDGQKPEIMKPEGRRDRHGCIPSFGLTE